MTAQSEPTDRDITQAAVGVRANELERQLAEFWLIERDKVILDVMASFDADGFLDKDYAVEKWLELRSLETIHKRIKKEMRKGDGAARRTSSLHPSIG